MEYFQKSIPPNFNSFRLESQTPEEEIVPNCPMADRPGANETRVPELQNPVGIFGSPHSDDSESDINAYAESMVQGMESCSP